MCFFLTLSLVHAFASRSCPSFPGLPSFPPLSYLPCSPPSPIHPLCASAFPPLPALIQHYGMGYLHRPRQRFARWTAAALWRLPLGRRCRSGQGTFARPAATPAAPSRGLHPATRLDHPSPSSLFPTVAASATTTLTATATVAPRGGESDSRFPPGLVAPPGAVEGCRIRLRRRRLAAVHRCGAPLSRRIPPLAPLCIPDLAAAFVGGMCVRGDSCRAPLCVA